MEQQLWNQSGQNHWQGTSFFPLGGQWSAPMPEESPAPPGDQPQGGAVMPPLTRAERMEAKRLEEQANFSFEGYQVVRREFISHRFDPAMTIRNDSITFNNACISHLEEATYVQFLINTEEQKLLIRPCSEGARDAVRWCVVKDDKRKSRQITCKLFTAKLYELMGWQNLYRYKLQGMQITYDQQPMYLFDLSASEVFLPQGRDKVTGKLKQPKSFFPEGWRESFGMPVAEHEASTNVDLMNGFEMASADNDSLTPPSASPQSQNENEVVKFPDMPEKEEAVV